MDFTQLSDLGRNISMQVYPINNYSKNIYQTGLKPAARPAFGSKKLLTQPIIDSCSFKHIDKSLEPKFLRSLLDIKDKDYFQRVDKIKNKLLTAMGYKHPEELKIEVIPMYDIASYVALKGQINIPGKQSGDKFIPLEYPTYQVIETLRHELEHMDQNIKLYKVKGEQLFLKACLCNTKLNGPEGPLEVNGEICGISQEASPVYMAEGKVICCGEFHRKEETMDDLRAKFNKKFYEIMTKDSSTDYFDTEKYYKAYCEYISPKDWCWYSSTYKYLNNLLEKDAYNVERKVLKALGKDPVVSADSFPENYETMVKLLKDNSFSGMELEDTLSILCILARVKNTETPENFKRLLKIQADRDNGKKLSNEDIYFHFKKLTEVEELQSGRLESVQKTQKRYQQVESWLREGKFFAEDILKDM